MNKDVFDMTLIERMVAAGMSRDCAAETAMWYMAQGDDEGLEDYVTALVGDKIDFYADMAKSFLCDKDAPEDKLARYYEYIVRG